LCRLLGIGGYTALRDHIRELTQQFPEVYLAPVSVGQEIEGLTTGQATAYVGMRALIDACSILDQAKIEVAAAVIVKATRVNVCGMGPLSGRIAEMVSFSLQELGITALAWV